MNTNLFAKSLIELLDTENRYSFLNKDNILWKFVEGEWIGKQAIFIGTEVKWQDELN